MIRIGVIGCGQWGPNHIRNFNATNRAQVLRCADRSAERRSAMERMFPGIQAMSEGIELATADDLDAVVVAAAPSSHYELTRAALESGKDVLCEKPLCVTSRESLELVRVAAARKRILMVGHVFLFNPGIQALQERIRMGSLGTVRHLSAVRTNLGPIRTDVNVTMDLASHDVSILNFLLNNLPESVSARGGAWLNKPVQDVAFLTLRYPNGILASVHVSWMDPRKVRQLTVVGDKGMAVWDDMHTSHPITIYDKQVSHVPYYESFGEFQLLTHEGDITSPVIKMTEPLKAQSQHFVDCVESRRRPLTDGMSGFHVVRVLEAIQGSMDADGAPVQVDARADAGDRHAAGANEGD